jgi:hypothetical protein
VWICCAYPLNELRLYHEATPDFLIMRLSLMHLLVYATRSIALNVPNRDQAVKLNSV